MKKPAREANAKSRKKTIRMSEAEHCCGPEHDTEFFDALAKLMKRFPEVGGKYAIKCIDHETDLMGIDFSKQVGLSQIKGKSVITEFVDAKKARISRFRCCVWLLYPYVCAVYWR